MITLRWAPYPESSVASYKVYRSMIGFRALLVDDVTRDGKTLELRLNGGALQTFTFNAVDEMVDSINDTITGGKAYPSTEDSDKFIIRSSLREDPGSVEIAGGSILLDIGETARLITEKSEDELIATVEAEEENESPVDYIDEDGGLQDYYALTTVDLVGNESLKTDYRQAIYFTGPVCVLEGLVTDVQGVRYVDAEVKARIVLIPQDSSIPSSITKDWVETLSGPDGRYSLPLLQGAVVTLEIPVLGFSRTIEVPETSYALVSEILVTTQHKYPLD